MAAKAVQSALLYCPEDMIINHLLAQTASQIQPTFVQRPMRSQNELTKREIDKAYLLTGHEKIVVAARTLEIVDRKGN